MSFLLLKCQNPITLFISMYLNCTFQTNSSQLVCSLFLVYYRFTPWTKSWLNLNSSSSRPSASRCSHKQNEKNSCQGKHSLVRVALRCYYCIYPCHLNLNVSAGECMAVLVHKHSTWIWVYNHIANIGYYVQNQKYHHIYQRTTLWKDIHLLYGMLMPSVQFHFHSHC